MKRRPSLLKKIWRKLVTPKPAPAVKTRVPARKVGSSLESLEGRISPAALINPTTLMYKDIDGDTVTVKFTKSIFTTTPAGVAIANNVFKFSDASNVAIANAVTVGPFVAANETPEQLTLINLTVAPTSAGKNLAIGTGIAITTLKVGTTNGVSDVGYINATGLPLGAVSISGDLGQIDAGSSAVLIGLASLKTKTLGVHDPANNQPAVGRSLVSNITGALGSLTVTGDMNTASIVVESGFNAQGQLTTIGKIGAVTIGGSLKGRAATEGASNSTGLINSATDIGAVKIGTLITDGIVGGGGTDAGSIQAGGKIASLTVSGEVKGGTGTGSGSVVAVGSLGPVSIKSHLSGGTGKESAVISGFGIGAVTIGGSIRGGADAGSGVISSLQNIGAVKVTGDIDGSFAGTTANSVGAASIRALGTMGGVTVVGKLMGGAGIGSGTIESGTDMGAVSVNAILGGAGQNSGSIFAGGKILTTISTKVAGKTKSSSFGITVKGDVMGGSGAGSGSVFSGTDEARIGDLGPVTIGGRLIGGAQDNSGSIQSGGKLASVLIGPAAVPLVQAVGLEGAGGKYSGSILSRGALGAVKISGHVQGGTGDFSGLIWSRDVVNATGEIAGNLGAVTVTGHVFGGGGADSGQIRADGKLASATIGELKGGNGNRSGSILAGQGIVTPGLVGAVTVKGAFTGGAGTQSGNIISEGKITSVLVTDIATNAAIRSGDDIGSVTFNKAITGVLVSARGMAIQGATADLAIAKISVLGDATGARFLGGYDTALVASNPDAQIGSVYVKGNWSGGDIVAGVVDGGAAGFGTTGDVKITGADKPTIVSQIASIIIGGTVTSTASGTDHFGFTAQKIVALKVGVTPFVFTAATGESRDIPGTDVTAREVPL